jgi:hypothetical protein
MKIAPAVTIAATVLTAAPFVTPASSQGDKIAQVDMREERLVGVTNDRAVDQEQRFASACFLDLEFSAVCGETGRYSVPAASVETKRRGWVGPTSERVFDA